MLTSIRANPKCSAFSIELSLACVTTWGGEGLFSHLYTPSVLPTTISKSHAA